MSQKIAEYLIGFSGDTSSLDAALKSISTSAAAAVTSINAQTAKIDLFQSAKKQADDAQKALDLATAKLNGYAAAAKLAEAQGGAIGSKLADNLKGAQKAVADATKELDRQNATVTRLGGQLSKAGVDTKNLAAEQARLATALKQATAAAQDQANKQALSVKSLGDIQPKLAQINAAYQQLASSGQFTLTQQIGLWGRWRDAVKDAKDNVPTLGDAISALRGPLLGVVGVVTAIGAAFVEVAKKYNAFNDSLLQGQAVSNATAASLGKLGDGAREIAVEFGENVQDAVRATVDLLRAGIPEGNVLDVLRVSAQTAQGTLSDLNKTTQLGITILNGYGLAATDLPKVFDQIVTASKAGGASVEELQGAIGDLLPIARAARVPFDQLLAAIVALRKGGLDTGTAIQSLQKLLVGLADPKVVAALRDLGVNVTDLAGTLEQISAKNLDLSQIRELGLDNRSIRGVLALTQGYQNFAGALNRVRTNAAGASAAAAAIVDKTQSDRVNQLAAAYQNLGIELGKVVSGKGGTLLVLMANLINGTTRVTQAIENLTERFRLLQAISDPLSTAFGVFKNALDALPAALQRLGTAAPAASAALTAAMTAAAQTAQSLSGQVAGFLSVVNAQLAAVQGTIGQLRGAITAAVGDLQTQITAAQQGLADTLKTIDQATAAQIAALQTQALSQQQLAEQTVTIETQAAAQRLQVIQQGAQQIIAAFNVEAAGRLAAVRGNAEQTKQVEQQLLVDRKAILAQFVTAYQAQIDQLTKAEAGYIQQIKAIDQQRVDFNRSIEDQINALRAQGLGAYEAYGQKVQQIDELIAAARAANFKGEFKQAQDYATQAQSLIGGISTAVTENGQTVIDSVSAQQTAISKLRDVQGEVNKALAGQATAAKEGRDATEAQLTAAQQSLKELKAQYDDLNTEIAKGIQAKITIDSADIQNALKELDTQLAQERKLTGLKLDLEGLQTQVNELADNVKAGFTSAAEAGEAVIRERLQNIADNAPELGLKTDAALKSLDTLKGQIDDITSAKQVNVTAELNAKDATKALDDLTRDRDVNVTVHVTAVGDVGALGAGGGAPPPVEAGVPGFARGGLVGALRAAGRRAQPFLRHFAGGGHVFSGRKVPGTGDRDTYRADLASGSFVLRKAASRFYGDTPLSKLAHFATGGIALGGAGGGGGGFSFTRPITVGLGGAGNSDYDDIVSKLQQIIDYSGGIPFATGPFPGIAEWASILMGRLGGATTEQLASVREKLDAGLQAFFDAADNARRWHVPAIVGPDWLSLLYQFASGGMAAGSDIVPAMLTPGEYVIPKATVDRVGVGFLSALNRMAVPRDYVSNMVGAITPRVRYYADGGLVAGSAGDVAAPRAAGGGDTFNINLNGIGIKDLYSTANVRRFLVPVLSDINRKR
ncbi:MAG: phage tail tape measure protein [Proteobacteria bacterium]|nr:phage tail tape measure protein [Pseudomonadota bacterium]